MERDVRDTPLYRESDALHRDLRRPGSGLISEAAEVSVHGNRVVFAGAIVDFLRGSPSTRICMTDIATGDTRVLTFGPGIDRLPKFSPSGTSVAFLSDRHQAGDYQLYILDPQLGASRRCAPVAGWVEYLHWSPNGRYILLGVAGHGADVSGGQGAVTTKESVSGRESWMPTVDRGNDDHHWRLAWVYDVESDQSRKVETAGLNVWEAVWLGDEAIAVVASPGPSEGLWYDASLNVVNLDGDLSREVHRPGEQIGLPSGSPNGCYLAFVEAVCSDRWIVAGALKLMEMASGSVRDVDTLGIDVTFVEWRSENILLVAGHRGFETAIGVYDTVSGRFRETWASSEVSTTGMYATVAGLNTSGDCVFVAESFQRAPEIARIEAGTYRPVKTFDVGSNTHLAAVEAVEQVVWSAPDGISIEGWLLRPKGNPPYPLVVNVHGGPIWQWHPTWLGRAVRAPILMLLNHGYAVFLPNPRGSTGKGIPFARLVMGDVGGADAADILAGIDHLVERGLADRNRLGVTGGSYGGFMSSWLITQDRRFSAAVPVAPVTNQVTAHLISNIPDYVRLSLQDTFTNPTGKYFHRSPVMHAHKTSTPTLSICGALDRCTPPEEAMQFHAALTENRVPSVLVTYPEEGHGIRKWPAAIDYTARLVAWFEEHMPAV